MKMLFAAALLLTSTSAFAGYTAEVCDTTDAGVVRSCRKVYFDRDMSVTAPAAKMDCHSERSSDVCDKPGAHVPAILVRINKWFLDRGFTPPPPAPDRN